MSQGILLTVYLTCLLCGADWLPGIGVAPARAGAFVVVEEPPRAQTAAAVRQHLQEQGHLQVWTTVLTELFHLPADVTVALAPCGSIDTFYSPAQQRLNLCDELLVYFARVFTPPGTRSAALEPAALEATLFTFLHMVGHTLIQVLDLPVTGSAEEAADELGPVFLMMGSAAEERAMLAGAQALFQRSRHPEPPHEVPFWALHPWTVQRYIHLRCLLYGSQVGQPPSPLEGDVLPDEGYMQRCRTAWQHRQQHWRTVLAPHLRPATSSDEPLPPRATLPTPDVAPVTHPLPTSTVPAPVQALHAYYEAINQRQYVDTWLMLAPQFKQKHLCCEADGSYQFSRYRAWWESVANAELLATQSRASQPDSAVVQATVRYTMKSGRVTEESHRFSLVAEPATRRWLLADQTRGVLQHSAR